MRAFTASAFVLVTVLVSSRLQAMNMPVYDLDSKVYLSTDIVLVQISMDETKHKIATVQETLFGDLPIGTHLNQIDGYLSYFGKINSGDQLILFLDRRPRKLGFIYKEFENVPYAIVPSGVELVDPFGHVHSYWQPMNPGGYLPVGYPFFPADKPLTEDDAHKFPTLSDEKQQIREAISSVGPARRILSHESTAEDVTHLLHFVDATPADSTDCAIRTASAIREDAIKQIRRRNDPDLLLRAETLSGGAKRGAASADEFLEPTEEAYHSVDTTKTFRAQRAEFLLNVLADKNRPMEERRTALGFLLYNSAWGHPYSGFAKVLPIDAPALASISSRIIEVSHSIFSDPKEDAVLRGMCLRFLDLDDQTNIAVAHSVYKTAKSDALRFEIEDVLLRKSDKLFLDLAPPSTEAASIVGIEPKPGCAPAKWPDPMFFGLYREHGYQDQAHRPETRAHRSTVLIDTTTGKTFELENANASYGSSSDGSGWGQFAVEKLEKIPAGEYSMEIQFRLDGRAIGHGYGLKLKVIEDSGRKTIVLDPEASRERPQLTFF